MPGYHDDPVQREELEREAKAQSEREKAARELERERKSQETKLVKEAVGLMRQETLKLDEISETFILRRLLTSAFSDASSERQWAVKALMDLKGMKPSKKTKDTPSEEGKSLLRDLQSSG